MNCPTCGRFCRKPELQTHTAVAPASYIVYLVSYMRGTCKIHGEVINRP